MSLRAVQSFPVSGSPFSEHFALAGRLAADAARQLRAMHGADDGGDGVESAAGHLLCAASGGKIVHIYSTLR